MGSGFKNVAVLISGRGSNLGALIEQQSHFRIIGVISDTPDAQGLELARLAGLTTLILDPRDYPSKSDFHTALLRALQELSPDLVVLAGFMRILQPPTINAFQNRLINIHPSLLPKLPGLHTHSRALASGDQEHGCTVHLVDSGVDTGAILAQAPCPILPTDSEHSLAARVLALEHRLLPWVINALSAGSLQISPHSHPLYHPSLLSEAQRLGFRLPS